MSHTFQCASKRYLDAVIESIASQMFWERSGGSSVCLQSLYGIHMCFFLNYLFLVESYCLFISVIETYTFILRIMPIGLYSYLLLYNTILVYSYATLMNIPAYGELPLPPVFPLHISTLNSKVFLVFWLIYSSRAIVWKLLNHSWNL